MHVPSSCFSQKTNCCCFFLCCHCRGRLSFLISGWSATRKRENSGTEQSSPRKYRPAASHRSLPPGSLHSQGSPLLVGRVGESPGNEGKRWGVVLLFQFPYNTPVCLSPNNFAKTIIFASGRTVYSKGISNKTYHAKFGRQIACKYSSLSISAPLGNFCQTECFMGDLKIVSSQ